MSKSRRLAVLIVLGLAFVPFGGGLVWEPVRTSGIDAMRTPTNVPLTTLARSSPVALSDRERRLEVWRIVRDEAHRFDLAGDALRILRVIEEESRFFTDVRSPDGRYLGLCQFAPRTFRANVEAMRGLGLIETDATYSPWNPVHSIRVMAWMWGQGYANHWGPARRVFREFARRESTRRS